MTEWLLIILLILISGFFSGSEVVFISANRIRIELKTRRSNKSNLYLSEFIQHPESFLETILTWRITANIMVAITVVLLMGDSISQIYTHFSGQLPNQTTLIFTSILLVTMLVLILGEFVPKIIAMANADDLIFKIPIPVVVSRWLVLPVIKLNAFLVSIIADKSGIIIPKTGYLYSRNEMEQLFANRSNGGQNKDNDRDDTELISNVLKLSSKRAKDSMVTRTEIVAVEKTTPIHEVLKVFVSSGYSKLPVYEETIDNIVGVILAYDLFKRPDSIEEIMRPIKMVPYSMKSKDLIAEFRKSNITLAIVLDEYGGTSGLVTIEDLAEEIVGDIEDEYDINVDILKKLNDTTYVLSGNVELEELTERFPELSLLPHPDYETVAGFIIHHAGKIPKVNEEIEVGSYKFIISKASPSRVETVRLKIMNRD